MPARPFLGGPTPAGGAPATGPIVQEPAASSGPSASAASGGGQWASGQPASGQPVRAASSTATLERLSSFTGVSTSNDASADTPPDTQVAVGPSDVAEAVNAELLIWNRSGQQLSSLSLNTFFPIPSGYFFSDPKLVYDPVSSRWFLSGWGVNTSTNSGTVYLAVSNSSDPTAGWSVYTVATESGTLTDQPKIGVTGDKVVVAWNDYGSSGFTKVEVWVLQKSDLLSGATVAAQSYTSSSVFNLVPAQDLSATNTAYLAYDTSTSLEVMTVTGSPASNDLATSTSGTTINAPTQPPLAAQPSGQSINTDDNRILSVVWDQGTLWAGANTACVPPGTSTSEPCAYVAEASVSSTGTQLVYQTVLSQAGGGIYYPAVTLDGSGQPFVVATASSSSENPSVVGFVRPSASGNFVQSSLMAGTGSYDCPSSVCGTSSRWGDYSGAVVDPSNSSDIWLAGEYGTSNSKSWGTSVAEVTLAGPSVSSLSPSSGPASGGTSVTVQGANFAPGTTVSFGSRPATAVDVGSPTQLTATAPAGTAGTSVNVTVSTPDGTSPTSGATSFGYTSATTTTSSSTSTSLSSSASTVAPGQVVTLSATVTSSSGAVPDGSVSFDANGATISGCGAVVPTNGVATCSSAFGSAGPEALSATESASSGFSASSSPTISLEVAYPGPPSAPIVAVAPTPDGKGYYLAAADGSVYAFGDARYAGSMAGQALNAPIVAMAVDPATGGYWLLGADGGVFSFNAPFFGSTGNLRLNAPAVGMEATPQGNGYRFVASDGGVFDFGAASFSGSLGATALSSPVAGMAAEPSGSGYWLAEQNGTVSGFGGVPNYGSA